MPTFTSAAANVTLFHASLEKSEPTWATQKATSNPNAPIEADRRAATRTEAESLARVLTARGRESIAWDREVPLVSDELPEDMLDRTYPQEQLSIRGVLRHVADAEWWYLNRLGLGGVQGTVLAHQIEEVGTVFNLARKPAPERVFNPAFLPALAERKVVDRAKGLLPKLPDVTRIPEQVKQAGLKRTAVILVGRSLVASGFRDSHLYSCDRDRSDGI